MSDLAGYLRSRREALTPADVGLPTTGRRRTPGLRREEVATLAGISIDYLVRLEQGRDVNPSPSVMGALAKALLLSEDERMHLAHLAAAAGEGAELCPRAQGLSSEVPPTVRALLDRLAPTPAVVLGPANDVLAANATFADLLRPLGLWEAEPPNLARWTFLHPGARRAHVDWERAADEQVGQLRIASVRYADDPDFAALVEDLRADEAFEARWAVHAVRPKRRGTKLLRHPDGAELRFDFEVLSIEGDAEQRMVTWLPADDATAAFLQPAARLRVVG